MSPKKHLFGFYILHIVSLKVQINSCIPNFVAICTHMSCACLLVLLYLRNTRRATLIT